MPVTIELNATYQAVLETDREKPAERRPNFVIRFLTSRQWRKLAAASDAMDEANSGNEVMDKVFESLRAAVVGWKLWDHTGAEIPFDPEKLEDVLTMPEARELLTLCLRQRPTPEEKKTSASPSA